MKELEIAAQEELIHSYSSSTVIISTYGEPAKIEKCKPIFFGQEAMLNMFRKGAKWQSEQSPWISVKEQLPIPVIEMIDGNEYGSIDVLGAIQNSYGDYDYYICRYWGYNKEYRWENGIAPDYWMPIPKFNA